MTTRESDLSAASSRHTSPPKPVSSNAEIGAARRVRDPVHRTAVEPLAGIAA